MKTKGRAIIYELGGIYLLYLSYSMYQNRMESTGLEYGIIIAVMILFLLFGIGLLGAGLFIMYKGTKNKDLPEEHGEDQIEEQIEEQKKE